MLSEEGKDHITVAREFWVLRRWQHQPEAGDGASLPALDHYDVIPVRGFDLRVFWAVGRARLQLVGNLFKVAVEAASDFPSKRATFSNQSVAQTWARKANIFYLAVLCLLKTLGLLHQT
jgi:hypothetical protein